YQPKYLSTVEALRELGAIPLQEVAKPAKRKFSPAAGQPFSYIEISDIDTSTGVINATTLLGEEAPDRAQWVVRKGDVIVSTVRPIRNAVALISEDEDGFVCSSGFAVLKAEAVAAELLFAFLKTKAIAELLDRQTKATMYPAVTWQDVLNIPILKPDEGLEQFVQEIAVLVQQSYQASRMARALLEEAKAKVEALIEGAAEAPPRGKGQG
ncbi:MAG: restriction endonuclease subunit S, partial [Dehalococcoidia bacterium]